MRNILKLVAILVIAGLPVAASPSPKPGVTSHAPTSCTHAFCKVVGGILFVAEDGIDVVHGALDVANKGLAAVAPVKVLVPVQYVVSAADSIAAKVDTGTEAAERYLFNQSN